jgi:hypothetical protein
MKGGQYLLEVEINLWQKEFNSVKSTHAHLKFVIT